ncbi:MAG: manganese catalase family protein [Lachnospiraceae bacterium]|nr:manganese catalase family protein [Lachnospiraceae bacterium]
MWNYERRLEYPVNITKPNAEIAKVILTQFGGPDGELAASQRYLAQRYSATNKKVAGVLTDIGTEELAHMEMICAIVHQLTKDLTADELKAQGFADYYVDHTIGLWPQAASGAPFSATVFQSKGDPITDLHEDMAAEQKARSTYENILRLVKDPEVCDPIKFLREREIVHYQRFGESLRLIQDELDHKNFYAFNPEFDSQFCK